MGRQLIEPTADDWVLRLLPGSWYGLACGCIRMPNASLQHGDGETMLVKTSLSSARLTIAGSGECLVHPYFPSYLWTVVANEDSKGTALNSAVKDRTLTNCLENIWCSLFRYDSSAGTIRLWFGAAALRKGAGGGLHAWIFLMREALLPYTASASRRSVWEPKHILPCSSDERAALVIPCQREWWSQTAMVPLCSRRLLLRA
ncbi:hypothetical protein NDU88_008661 [Pleurodeles waltl]|uniref:Uncharacterized protein n=1 Tax=Pleurodeles waltl TaxID=8319 RepID=A0AAV7NX72_PLEWA|nr:hypothetical protein NDU88_008661 [Pleurodeles waltl]